MLACIDAHHLEDAAIVACILFRQWDDAGPVREIVRRAPRAEAYVPGQFYRRELPGAIAVLERVHEPLDVVIVDGYVWLGSKPGFGEHLFRALAERVPVVGVAKNPYRGSAAVEVTRGQSARPLYVTAIGMDAREAAERVRSMHGPYRVPTLLRRVDQLCRTAARRPRQ